MMLIITNHQGMEHSTTITNSVTLFKWIFRKREKSEQVLVRIWKKWRYHALLVDMHIGSATMENSMEVPKKLKNRMTT